jgi:hypothetical protein
MMLAVAIVPVPAAVAAAGSAPAARAAAAAGPAWAGSTAPVAGLNPAPTAPSGDGVVLGSVSCPAAGSCVAIGNYDVSSIERETVIETLSGGSWTAATAPAPAGGNDVDLQALSCPAAGSCVAAGYYEDQSRALHPLIDTLSGGTWTATTAPTSSLNPGPWTSPTLTFRSLSCPAAGSCFAVGSYLAVPDKEDGLIATLANGTWSDATAPVSGLDPPPGTSTADIVNLNVYQFNAPAYATSAASWTAGIAADGPGFQPPARARSPATTRPTTGRTPAR